MDPVGSKPPCFFFLFHVRDILRVWSLSVSQEFYFWSDFLPLLLVFLGMVCVTKCIYLKNVTQDTIAMTLQAAGEVSWFLLTSDLGWLCGCHGCGVVSVTEREGRRHSGQCLGSDHLTREAAFELLCAVFSAHFQLVSFRVLLTSTRVQGS